MAHAAMLVCPSSKPFAIAECELLQSIANGSQESIAVAADDGHAICQELKTLVHVPTFFSDISCISMSIKATTPCNGYRGLSNTSTGAS